MRNDPAGGGTGTTSAPTGGSTEPSGWIAQYPCSRDPTSFSPGAGCGITPAATRAGPPPLLAGAFTTAAVVIRAES
jgi:hypothetical protein